MPVRALAFLALALLVVLTPAPAALADDLVAAEPGQPTSEPADPLTVAAEPPLGVPLASSDAPASEPLAGAFGVPPVRLVIPRLGVDAVVLPVGLEADGTMAAPRDPDTVGWYEYGAGLGPIGNAVLGGHVDWGGVGRVFFGLRRLAPGDRVLAYAADGAVYVYEVVDSAWYRAETAPVREIFAQTETPQLTLITCGGAFDRSRREYLDRLVVRATLVEVAAE